MSTPRMEWADYGNHDELDRWDEGDEWGDDRPMMFTIERPWLWLAISTSVFLIALAVLVVVAFGVLA